MPAQVANNLRFRRSFGRIKKIIDLPYLIEIQKNSYELFLQKDLSAAQRMGPSLRRQFDLFGQTSEPVQFVLKLPLYDRCHASDQTVHFLTQINQFIS